ncbi:Dehydrogenase E1 component [Fragilaria crotonensis]|nr:Dehydrogenase E1 component [Fragilaria crotonensis]
MNIRISSTQSATFLSRTTRRNVLSNLRTIRKTSSAQELLQIPSNKRPESYSRPSKMRIPPQQTGKIRENAGVTSATSLKNEEPIAHLEGSTKSSPSELTYTGGLTIPITSFLHIVTPGEDAPSGIWPIFRLMDENGSIRDAANDGYKSGVGRQSEDVTYYGHSRNIMRPSQNQGGNATQDSSNDDLQGLRSALQNKFPLFHFDVNPLLQSAKHEYPDTANTNTLLRAYIQMIRLRQMDSILQNAQRQGRISFYMTCRGEEAIHFGAASALSLEDTVLAQYREAGVLMWRGFTLQQFADQCFSNKSDLGKARQMPIHYGSRALNYQTISSPLGTQLPQAVGAAYLSKLEQKPNVTIVFFGDGCASAVDFHSACNFAATLKVPVIFFCRNNGYAISTPVTEQFAGDGVISRCKGYGMAGLRVDGNDLFAVCAAVHAAKMYALENSSPVMIEAMTYRQGHHSTSDDSTRYRTDGEVRAHDLGDPFLRISSFLRDYGILDFRDSMRIEDAEKFNVLQAMEAAEKKGPPPIEELFEDVYKVMPDHLKRQERQLLDHLGKMAQT